MAFVPPARHLLRGQGPRYARYAEPPQVEDLARAAGLSKAHLRSRVPPHLRRVPYRSDVVSERVPGGPRDYDRASHRLVAIEVWDASTRVPANILEALPAPAAAQSAAA